MNSQTSPKVLFRRQEIAATVSKLAAELRQDYQDKYPLLIGVLKGSFIFTADLIRQLDFPLEVEFIRLSSYGRDKESSGKVKVVQGLRAKVRGRHVLVIEDIVDSGLTIAFLLDYLRQKKPASLKLCALTDKPSRRQTPVTIDYLGFTVPDKFLVGYGLDWDEQFRNLPDICVMEQQAMSCPVCAGLRLPEDVSVVERQGIRSVLQGEVHAIQSDFSVSVFTPFGDYFTVSLYPRKGRVKYLKFRTQDELNKWGFVVGTRIRCEGCLHWADGREVVFDVNKVELL
ncbi:MAG: hypoxanthine phosphoribosyltransferase [Chloroflexi bacterium]|nr:hypoxanthine phosphoribosyltransferase [Chloroflexota bacterium]